MNWKVFYTRSLTAIVFAAVMLIGLLGTGPYFFALLLLIQFLCIREYFRLLRKTHPDNSYTGALETVVQVTGVLSLYLNSSFSSIGNTALPTLLIIPSALILWQSLSAKSNPQVAFQATGGLLYICMPVSMLFLLKEKSLLLPLGLIGSIWINDTMAYIVGSFIGKTPFSKISPKKTWEGTIGGALLTILAAAMFGTFSPYYTVTDWVCIALCAAIAGTLGDLFESKLKRDAGVKDSGSFMPGHGGALDRFDSLLISTPFAFGYAYYFMDTLPIHIF